MRVEVNGREKEIAPESTALELLGTLGLDPRGVVVERNRKIVRRDDLPGTRLEEGDRIEIVHFVGGG